MLVFFVEIIASKNAKKIFLNSTADFLEMVFDLEKLKNMTYCQFSKMRILALAYSMNGTAFYKDPKILSAVKDGLDIMVQSTKYDGKKYFGNWWYWQIGVPRSFIDILMILADELPLEKIQQYANIISKYVSGPYRRLETTFEQEFADIESGGIHKVARFQQASLTATLLGLGILQKNKTTILESVNSTIEIFHIEANKSSTSYRGEFMRHIPALGLKGNEMLRTLQSIIIITQGSNFEVAPDLTQSFVESVEAAFIPLIYKGEIIAPVTGRAISRPSPKSKTGYGSDTMYNLLNLAKLGSAKSEKNIKESTKYWMRLNPEYYLSNVRNYDKLKMTVAILNDSTIVGDKLPYVGTKMYSSIDRFVQRTREYMLCLSFYSKRVSAFEAGNNENKRGWHTADGAIYLYNEDEVQFMNDYWPTVDPYRIPGTTVDTRQLSDELSSFSSFTSEEKWAGGVAYAHQAVVGMA